MTIGHVAKCQMPSAKCQVLIFEVPMLLRNDEDPPIPPPLGRSHHRPSRSRPTGLCWSLTRRYVSQARDNRSECELLALHI